MSEETRRAWVDGDWGQVDGSSEREEEIKDARFIFWLSLGAAAIVAGLVIAFT